ncbi:HEPN domain-containing protein [Synechococcus sp. Cruz-9H2]|uniref:HEPN domain-containing protein n=1 Tax=unclassified Synechococcus TaxID=2626047 RepID=UPI0020CE6B2B|nr:MULTISPECIES: HEPN domain-containing protein [unclassified Synechococcus]MCP9819407.1 HEPN domain-containing protein [Synechococcus sp. Cruz-9H2]MCP9843200.1 HEPN domain-containing protein [Synechococcus sp. Edmonson 11F2]MCP9854945.1 HEPN domain-containing protein [Synechococcus sp. Cruz-9C9]MCP9862584.1 HEPN domain-containing protein [Synechococcus sp. Cruz-7E5]MCP9870317.1 HEPN domain-containing protein [Synechococcus sp. Cruz-7B9]
MAEPWSAVPEWIAKAEGDWEALEILLTRNSPGLRDAVVFHAQQCVEKLFKARLIQLGQTVDKIHDLATLSRQLEAVDRQWSWDGEELADLSSGAVLARYPGFETSAEEQADLVQIASKLRQALRILLGSEQQEE